MSDAPEPQFFRFIAGGRKDGLETAPCALLLDPQTSLEVATARLTWSALLGGRLREIARAAAESGRPEGRSLPFASLRAVLQVQVPDAVMLASDLGRPWAREDGGAFLHVAEGTEGTCARRASSALRTWIGMVLRPWAMRLGLDEGLVDAIDNAADAGQAFALDAGLLDLAKSIATDQPFDRLRHPVLQEVSRRLEGMSLFPGLGPVYRVIRGRSTGNEVKFQTWPVIAKAGGLYSMVASLSLETMPYIRKPVLVVRASRRRWLEQVPDQSKLRLQRSLTGYLMGRTGPPIAIEFAASVRTGVPEEPCSPEFMHQALSVRADLALPFAEMVQARNQDVFLGIPYSPQRDGKAKVGAGATTRDQLDLLDAVMPYLAPIGLRPLPFWETQETKRTPKRGDEYHKALAAEALVADLAVTLGSNELEEGDLLEAARMLMDGGEPPSLSSQTALAGRLTLEAIKDANRGRLVRVFGDARPAIVLIARRESERPLMRAAINGLFGGSIDIAERQLPRDVHGARQDLPEADGKAKARMTARVEAWRELAEELSLTYGGCHALVQADEWYGNRHDDPVNKLAGRQALATVADANVQYLLPSAGGWRGLAKYLHRIQSAVYDLMFGHSGLVTEVRSLLRGDFPTDTTRPRAIIGISLVTQARLRNGAQGGQICLATRIDGETGQTTARIGWFENAMRWSPWLSFFDAMKHIAHLNVAMLGPTEEGKRRSYQLFVENVVDGAVDAGDRPLVLIDSTSAARMWPWLTDAKIGGSLVIGPESIDKSARWASARLVRVRYGHAGRVLERKSARYQRVNAVDGALVDTPNGLESRYCPTVTAKTIEVSGQGPGDARHYWVTGSYLETMPRGLSVYRELDTFVPVDKVRNLQPAAGLPTKGLLTRISIDLAAEPYRVPNGLDVTVATVNPGDLPDRIAHLVASGRRSRPASSDRPGPCVRRHH